MEPALATISASMRRSYRRKPALAALPPRCSEGDCVDVGLRATASGVSSVLGLHERCDQRVDLAFEPDEALTLSADVVVKAADPGHPCG